MAAHTDVSFLFQDQTLSVVGIGDGELFQHGINLHIDFSGGMLVASEFIQAFYVPMGFHQEELQVVRCTSFEKFSSSES